MLFLYRGTVIKMGVPRMLETQKLFRCGLCGEIFPVLADYEQYYRTERPTACPNLRDPDRRCKVRIRRACVFSGGGTCADNGTIP